jgi:hypothetical protein
MPLFRPFNLGEIASAVDDTDDLHAVFGYPIKGYPAFDDERSCAVANLWAGRTELRVISQELTASFDAVINLVSDEGASWLYIEPDLQKVFAGTSCKPNLGHAHSRFRRGKTRASFLF